MAQEGHSNGIMRSFEWLKEVIRMAQEGHSNGIRRSFEWHKEVIRMANGDDVI